MALFTFFLLIDESYTGGYRFSYPATSSCTRFGLLSALLGLVASIIGKGNLRLGIALISTLNLWIWFGAAMTPAEFPQKFGHIP